MALQRSQGLCVPIGLFWLVLRCRQSSQGLFDVWPCRKEFRAFVT